MIDHYINQIINDDCLNVLKEMPSNCVDLVLTDPPYGMDFQSNHREKKYAKLAGDNEINYLYPIFQEIARVSKPDAHIYCFASFHKIEIFKAIIDSYLGCKNILIREKNNTSMGDLTNDYAPKYEMILFANSGKPLNGKRDPNILKFARTANELHPTQKPIRLIAYLIEKSSNAGDIVLDPFLGSGTTALACKKLGRRFIGIEKDPEYCKIAKRRITLDVGLFDDPDEWEDQYKEEAFKS